MFSSSLPWQWPLSVLGVMSLHLRVPLPCPLAIMNVIPYGIYLMVATNLFRTSLSTARIRGWPLNGVRRLFEQIQYTEWPEHLTL